MEYVCEKLYHDSLVSTALEQGFSNWGRKEYTTFARLGTAANFSVELLNVQYGDISYVLTSDNNLQCIYVAPIDLV